MFCTLLGTIRRSSSMPVPRAAGADGGWSLLLAAAVGILLARDARRDSLAYGVGSLLAATAS